MRKLSTIFLILTLLVGVGFFIYPDVASWWNGRIQAGVIDTYRGDVAAMEQAAIDAQIQRAIDFNESINEININDPFAEIDALPEDYLATLNVGDIMATIEIPVVNISMPIRHGTSSHTLDIGAGHLAGTSFPVGGSGTHAVITAHSGLSNSTMFTPLLDERFGIGELFFIDVLDQRLAYRVIQFDTVWPHEVDLLTLHHGEDFVTLITCTPLAINSHRLLVRGTRVPYTPDMAEAIVPVISIVEANWRLATTMGAFFGFLFIFGMYQSVRIVRTRWKKRLVSTTVTNLPVEPEFSDDDYVLIPGEPAQPRVNKQGAPVQTVQRVQHTYVYERVTPLEVVERANAPRGGVAKQGFIRRYVMIGLALVIMLGGAGVMLFPQIQRVLYQRYADNLMSDWLDRRDDYRQFLQSQWIYQSNALISTISDLPVGYTNGGMPLVQVAAPGEYDEYGNYIPGEITMISIGNMTFDHISQLYESPQGYLMLGDTPLGNNGHLTIADLFVTANGGFTSNGIRPHPEEPGLYVDYGGNLFIDVGGGVYITNNGGNISLGVLSICDAGNLYIGDTPINDILLEFFDCEEFDLYFIFNFDIDRDPMHWADHLMNNYNYDLHENNQSSLTSLEASEEVDFSVVTQLGFTEEMLGIVEIPAINVRLPIFAGSSHINMLRGAAHMTQTSLPVGGMNTNSVITAHRGLTRAVMFTRLDELKYTNEIIYIINPYQTLRYRVFDYEIVADRISFDERTHIMVQEGRDMITLLTCHPYRINNQRLLIFAERIPD